MNHQEKVDGALLEASKWNDLAACEAALDAGADMCAVDERGQGVFVAALYKERINLMRFLAKQKGAEEAANVTDDYGWTPLHYAANCDQAEFIELLLTHGALPSLNAIYKFSITPLMVAARFGHTECACVLLRAGANPFIKDQHGLTARDYAYKNRSDLAMAMLDHSAELISRRLPTLALALEELEKTGGLFIPREIINLFLASSFRFSF